MKRLMIFAATLVMSGCASYDAGFSAVNTYAGAEIAAQQKSIQGANDNAAKAWAEAGCAIPYGTVVRNASTIPGLPVAVERLCGVLPLPTTPTALGGSSITPAGAK